MKTLIVPVTALLLAAAAIPAHAAAPEFFTWSGQVSIANDGISKGVSETTGNPQAVFSATATHQWFYMGLNLKNVSTPEGGDDQQQWYFGARNKVQGFTVNAQVWLKNTDNTRHGTDHHFVEYQADISRTFGATTAKLLVLYSPDFYGATRRSTWIEASLAQKLSPQWTLNGGFGARSTRPAKNYRDWNLGALWTVLPKTSIDFHYYDTDEHHLGKNYDGRFIVTLAQKF